MDRRSSHSSIFNSLGVVVELPYEEEKEEIAVAIKNQNRILFLGVALMGLTFITPVAQSKDDHAAKVKEAAGQSVKAGKVFDEIMQTPDKAIPQDLLAHAKAIAVFPQVIKAAFIFGGEGGRGVVTRRTSAGWSDPVYFRAGGGSVGPQIGASATDIVLLFMNDDAVAGLMKDKFELGGEVAVAGGPVGREASADTDALMHAEILSYSRSRGLFAGINLKGVVIQPEDGLNQAVYDKSARELLGKDGQGAADSTADLPAFKQTVAKYTATPAPAADAK
jgi:lipid-binding SYLF domain-containing protein